VISFIHPTPTVGILWRNRSKAINPNWNRWQTLLVKQFYVPSYYSHPGSVLFSFLVQSGVERRMASSR
jgi:hypothetical protein